MADNTNSDDPGQWRLVSGGLFMREGGADGGQLARLEDVRDWLMREREWPMARAADEIIRGLRSAVSKGETLFIADPKDYARPLRPSDTILTPQKYPETDIRLLGFEGVCNAIINGWLGEYEGYSSGRLSAVSVRAAVAGELWGWGGAAEAGAADPFPLADYEALKAYRLVNPRSPWLTGHPDDNQIAVGKAEFARRGGNDAGQKSKVLEAMGAELGQSRKTLDTALFGARKRVTKTAPKSPLPSVTDKAA